MVSEKFLERGGVKIPYYTWDVAHPQAVLIFIHGLKSHAGWFLESGAAFAAKNIKVYAFDRRGSGKSEAERGHIDDYHLWLEEIRAVCSLADQENPGLIPHLLGHCFGARLALGFEIVSPGSVKSLILMSPPIFSTKADIRIWEKVQVFLSFFLPVSSPITVPIRDEMFTGDPEKNRFIAKDHLKLESMTPAFCREVFRLDRKIERNLSQITLPCLVLLAKEDEVVRNEKIEKDFLKRLNSKTKKCVTFDSKHHLFFEPEHEKVMDRIMAWIRS